MNEEEWPKCRFCGVELGEAWTLKHGGGHEPLRLCGGCYDLIKGVSHDSAVTIFSDIVKVMNSPVKPAVTWEEKLELVNLEEREANG